MTEFEQNSRTTVKMIPDRGRYDKETIYSIIDEALICHVGIVESDQPVVIPTIHARMGDELLLHGSPASRLLKAINRGAQICVTITHLDGLVLARSALHHSMNYRSAVLFGTGSVIKDLDKKEEALKILVEHLVPGRWEDSRKPTEAELKSTMVVAVPISEASAKIRTGPPIDEDEDYSLPFWAGVLPLRLTPSAPVPDPQLSEGIAVPPYVTSYK